MSQSTLEIAQLKNLGPTSARWLNEAGIYTKADLARLGAVAAYRQVQALGYRPSVNLVYAIQGALMDLHWTDLPPSLKTELKTQLEKE